MLVASPVVSVAVVAGVLLVTTPPRAPPPASEPIVSLLPARSSVTPGALASVTAPVSAIAEPPASFNVPALIAVVPV